MMGSGHFDLLGIMENLVRVTSHLDWRRTVENQGDRWYPQLVPTSAGKPFIMTAKGDVWRAFSYRQGHILRADQPMATLASAGAMYGRFTAQTVDLGGPPLIETAPGFHDLDRVLDELTVAMEAASAHDKDMLGPDLELIAALKQTLERRCADDGVAWSPDRVVHNDTKLTNVLFDRDHGRATAVLDLDLAMMGPSWHDAGDLFRSSCWTTKPAVSPDGGPSFSPELFDSVIGAFVESASEALSEAEIVTYAAAGPRITLELGVRYLHDHLRPEPHLQVKGKDGHLHRGRANLMLAQEMLGAYDALRHIVDGFLAER